MALKTFNVDDVVYKAYSKHCKNRGISMSHQVENFLREEILKIKKTGVRNNFESKEIAKEIKEIENVIEHPLKKYC
jgi:hypothetical protein